MACAATRRANPIPAHAGIGLRYQHHAAVTETRPPVAWLEVHSENYMGGGAPIWYLEQVRRDYPVSLHGVGLSLGTHGPLDREHLACLAHLVARIEPGLVSEHLSFSVVDGVYLDDLLPLPYTDETLAVVARHVEEVQERLGRRLLIENPSRYLRFKHSPIPEPEFLGELSRRTGCGILLDVNNVFVSAHNLDFDAEAYLAAVPADAVGEIHLAGHAVNRVGDLTVRIDDHGSRVCDAVWALYREALAHVGPVPVLIEWDTDVPPLAVLVGEAQKAERIMVEAISGEPA